MKRADVEQAIHALKSAGLNPSMRLIRERIGYGSLTDIQKICAEIRNEEQLAAQPEHQMPKHLQDRVKSTIDGIWLELSQASLQAVADTKRLADEQIAQANKAASEALVTADGLMGELEGAQREVSSLERLFAEETMKRTSAEQEAAILRHRLEDALLHGQSLQKTIETLVARTP